MAVTRHLLADKIVSFLRQETSLAELVDWAERAMVEGAYSEADFDVIADILSHLAVADVKAFGLSWEDCRNYLERLGYQARVEVTAG